MHAKPIVNLFVNQKKKKRVPLLPDENHTAFRKTLKKKMNHFCLIRKAQRSSIASSIASLLAERSSGRSHGRAGALGSLGYSLDSHFFKHLSGLTKSHGHVRRFSIMNGNWNNMRRNGDGSDAFMSKNNMDSSSPMDFVRGIVEQEGMDIRSGIQFSRHNVERDADFVHIKMLRNNTFVTVTDSKGNIKLSASAGCFKELKAGQKLSRYAAEATAEEVGRRCRGLGLKSVVMKVKGNTYFKKKRQAIVSWREGFTDSPGGQSPIVYIEDTTRRPHNGCRLPKKRRI